MRKMKNQITGLALLAIFCIGLIADISPVNASITTDGNGTIMYLLQYQHTSKQFAGSSQIRLDSNTYNIDPAPGTTDNAAITTETDTIKAQNVQTPVFSTTASNKTSIRTNQDLSMTSLINSTTHVNQPTSFIIPAGKTATWKLQGNMTTNPVDLNVTSVKGTYGSKGGGGISTLQKQDYSGMIFSSTRTGGYNLQYPNLAEPNPSLTTPLPYYTIVGSNIYTSTSPYPPTVYHDDTNLVSGTGSGCGLKYYMYPKPIYSESDYYEQQFMIPITAGILASNVQILLQRFTELYLASNSPTIMVTAWFSVYFYNYGLFYNTGTGGWDDLYDGSFSQYTGRDGTGIHSTGQLILSPGQNDLIPKGVVFQGSTTTQSYFLVKIDSGLYWNKITGGTYVQQHCYDITTQLIPQEQQMILDLKFNLDKSWKGILSPAKLELNYDGSMPYSIYSNVGGSSNLVYTTTTAPTGWVYQTFNDITLDSINPQIEFVFSGEFDSNNYYEFDYFNTSAYSVPTITSLNITHDGGGIGTQIEQLPMALTKQTYNPSTNNISVEYSCSSDDFQHWNHQNPDFVQNQLLNLTLESLYYYPHIKLTWNISYSVNSIATPSVLNLTCNKQEIGDMGIDNGISTFTEWQPRLNFSANSECYGIVNVNAILSMTRSLKFGSRTALTDTWTLTGITNATITNVTINNVNNIIGVYIGGTSFGAFSNFAPNYIVNRGGVVSVTIIVSDKIYRSVEFLNNIKTYGGIMQCSMEGTMNQIFIDFLHHGYNFDDQLPRGVSRSNTRIKFYGNQTNRTYVSNFNSATIDANSQSSSTITSNSIDLYAQNKTLNTNDLTLENDFANGNLTRNGTSQSVYSTNGNEYNTMDDAMLDYTSSRRIEDISDIGGSGTWTQGDFAYHANANLFNDCDGLSLLDTFSAAQQGFIELWFYFTPGTTQDSIMMYLGYITQSALWSIKLDATGTITRWDDNGGMQFLNNQYQAGVWNRASFRFNCMTNQADLYINDKIAFTNLGTYGGLLDSVDAMLFLISNQNQIAMDGLGRSFDAGYNLGDDKQFTVNYNKANYDYRTSEFITASDSNWYIPNGIINAITDPVKGSGVLALGYTGYQIQTDAYYALDSTLPYELDFWLYVPNGLEFGIYDYNSWMFGDTNWNYFNTWAWVQIKCYTNGTGNIYVNGKYFTQHGQMNDMTAIHFSEFSRSQTKMEIWGFGSTHVNGYQAGDDNRLYNCKNITSESFEPFMETFENGNIGDLITGLSPCGSGTWSGEIGTIVQGKAGQFTLSNSISYLEFPIHGSNHNGLNFSIDCTPAQAESDIYIRLAGSQDLAQSYDLKFSSDGNIYAWDEYNTEYVLLQAYTTSTKYVITFNTITTSPITKYSVQINNTIYTNGGSYFCVHATYDGAYEPSINYLQIAGTGTIKIDNIETSWISNQVQIIGDTFSTNHVHLGNYAAKDSTNHIRNDINIIDWILPCITPNSFDFWIYFASDDDQYEQYTAYIDGNSDPQFGGITFFQDGGYCQVYYVDKNNNNYLWLGDSGNAWNYDIWYHVTISFNYTARKISLLFNGQQITIPIQFNANAWPTRVRLFRGYGWLGNYAHNGMQTIYIDDLNLEFNALNHTIILPVIDPVQMNITVNQLIPNQGVIMYINGTAYQFNQSSQSMILEFNAKEFSITFNSVLNNMDITLQFSCCDPVAYINTTIPVILTKTDYCRSLELNFTVAQNGITEWDFNSGSVHFTYQIVQNTSFYYNISKLIRNDLLLNLNDLNLQDTKISFVAKNNNSRLIVSNFLLYDESQTWWINGTRVYARYSDGILIGEYKDGYLLHTIPDDWNILNLNISRLCNDKWALSIETDAIWNVNLTVWKGSIQLNYLPGSKWIGFQIDSYFIKFPYQYPALLSINGQQPSTIIASSGMIYATYGTRLDSNEIYMNAGMVLTLEIEANLAKPPYPTTNHAIMTQITPNVDVNDSAIQYIVYLLARDTYPYYCVIFNSSLDITDANLISNNAPISIHRDTGNTFYWNYTSMTPAFFTMFLTINPHVIQGKAIQQFNNGTQCKLLVKLFSDSCVNNVTVYVDISPFQIYMQSWEINNETNIAITESINQILSFTLPVVNGTTVIQLEGKASIPVVNFDHYKIEPYKFIDPSTIILYQGVFTFKVYSKVFQVNLSECGIDPVLDGIHYMNISYNIDNTGIFSCPGWGTGISSAYLQFTTKPIISVRQTRNGDWVRVEIDAALPVLEAQYVISIKGDSRRLMYQSVNYTEYDANDTAFLIMGLNLNKGLNVFYFKITAVDPTSNFIYVMPVIAVAAIVFFLYYARKKKIDIKAWFKEHFEKLKEKITKR